MTAATVALELIREVAGTHGLRVQLLDATGVVMERAGDPPDGEVPAEPEVFAVEGETVTARCLAGDREFLALPVHVGAGSTNHLVASWPKGDGPARRLAQALGAVLDVCSVRDYENENMSENLVQVFEEESTLLDLSRALPTCTNVSEMADMVLERLSRATGATRGVFALTEPGSATYEVVSCRPTPGAGLADTTFAIDQGLIGLAIREKRCIYLESPALATVPLIGLEARARRNLLAVPMPFTLTKDDPESREILGALCLMDREGEFGSIQQGLADAIAVLVGALLGTMTLAKFRKELEVGKAIQDTLLPERAPELPGYDIAGKYRQANKVGGDYFDFVSAADDALTSIVADVSGHDLASGMMMLMARALLRAISASGEGPAGILKHLSSYLFQDLLRNERFITLFVARTWPGSRQIQIANAGHTPPIWWRARHRTSERVEAEGSLVGMVQHQDFEERSLTMERGDLLVIYTDGLIEATNAADEMFGEDNLRRIIAESAELSAAEILDRIFSKVQAFAEREVDDLTAVVLKAV